MNDYYVYVYIDPRNYEEFYFGKGRGSRKTPICRMISIVKSHGASQR